MNSISESSSYSCHCLCGRTFPGEGPLAFHRQTCRGSKRKIEQALGNVKNLKFWSLRAKKQRQNQGYADTGGQASQEVRYEAFLCLCPLTLPTRLIDISLSKDVHTRLHNNNEATPTIPISVSAQSIIANPRIEATHEPIITGRSLAAEEATSTEPLAEDRLNDLDLDVHTTRELAMGSSASIETLAYNYLQVSLVKPRRSQRSNIQLPIRFRVPLPQALPPASAAAPQVEPDAPNTDLTSLEADPPMSIAPLRNAQQCFSTPRNMFGLFRRYFSRSLSGHDPEQYLELPDLTEESTEASGDISAQITLAISSTSEVRPNTSSTYFPYPNESSFRLGDWYWAGTQKSQESFNELIAILKSPSFRTSDIHNTPWSQINATLSSDDGAESGFEWQDEVAGWECTPIIISVPFHQRAKSPGPKPYIAGNLYHRSLVAIIREKLSDPQQAAGFHYDPFELFWQPGDITSETRLGTVQDMKDRRRLIRVDDEVKRQKVKDARAFIYDKHLVIDSEAVEKLLKEESLVPTDNVFSKRLAPLGFSVLRALLPDIMHEFELGVWRALFIHLIRILEAYDKNLVAEMDRRLIPTFGRDTIRRFSANVSELKKLAARDYEDILQCSIAVFDGLLPEPHNTAIMKLLFTCSHWHALAKLRMHTDITLDIMDLVTTRLGRELRSFAKNTCTAFDTRELKREVAARHRRKLRAALAASSQRGIDPAVTADGDMSEAARHEIGPRMKRFNLNTVKLHALGDHANTIREFGTNDSHSTEVGELEHRTPIARYPRTSRKYFVRQLANIDRRVTRLRRIRERTKENKPVLESVPSTPEQHHHIGISETRSIHTSDFFPVGAADPAIKNFLIKLKEHLLLRCIETGKLKQDGNASQVLLKRDRIYQHAICRINYTTYDVRREQDTINASSPHCNVLVQGQDDANSCDTVSQTTYRYARVLGTFHANVICVGQGMVDYNATRMEFLWVRWYQLVHPHAKGSWAAQKLDRICFAPLADADSFGFVDPDDVLRGCHILPAFAKGRRHPSGKGLSFLAKDGMDWKEYIVNRDGSFGSAEADTQEAETDLQEAGQQVPHGDEPGDAEGGSDSDASETESAGEEQEDSADESDDDEFSAVCEMYHQ
ncbi:hypothetical protein HWV62_22187 [Athelia sp. TMB]|nr:hypothetical protein HWV62_22187 [Athelia sp. TMB]